MKINLCLFYLLLPFLSCSILTKNKGEAPPVQIDQEWTILLNMQNENWSKERVLQRLGVPAKIVNNKKSKNEYLIYSDGKSNHQNWSIGIKGDKLISISFFPNLSNENNFSLDQVLKNWGTNCLRKVEIDSSQHFVLKKTYLDCGQGRKVRINNLNQVEGLFVEFY